MLFARLSNVIMSPLSTGYNYCSSPNIETEHFFHNVPRKRQSFECDFVRNVFRFPFKMCSLFGSICISTLPCVLPLSLGVTHLIINLSLISRAMSPVVNDNRVTRLCLRHSFCDAKRMGSFKPGSSIVVSIPSKRQTERCTPSCESC